MNNEFENWIKTRPEIIQKIALAYPPGEYKISENAPYGFTYPGTIITLIAYNEDGNVRIRVKPENILPEGINHAKCIRPSFEISKYPIDAYINPEYLIRL